MQWGRKSDDSELAMGKKERRQRAPTGGARRGEGAGLAADPDGREEKGSAVACRREGRGGSTVVGRGGSARGGATDGASVQRPARRKAEQRMRKEARSSARADGGRAVGPTGMGSEGEIWVPTQIWGP